ncbi:MAG: tetratricopeptide repeat protein [Rickettsiales bacterium]|nr:tetratricopeptide repeat protein [Rickettsiales bacterium]
MQQPKAAPLAAPLPLIEPYHLESRALTRRQRAQERTEVTPATQLRARPDSMPRVTSAERAIPVQSSAITPPSSQDLPTSEPVAMELPPLEPPQAAPVMADVPPENELPVAPLASESSSVSELPVAQSSDDGTEVKFFTPDSPVPVASEASATTVSAAPEQLTDETLNILQALPADALPKPSPKTEKEAGGDFAIKHAADSVPFAATATEVPAAHGESTMAINVKPQSIDLNYELEKAYNALVSGDTDSAIHIYEDVLSIDPNEKTALFGLATTYHRIGLLAQARPIYGRLLKIDPYNVEALNNFFALVGAEAPHAAIEQLELLAVENPDFGPIEAQIALLYQKLNDYPKAIEHMAKAAAISPENLAYKYNLAVLYDTHGDAKEAMRLYRYLMTLYNQGQDLPAPPKAIQERLTFLSSN